MSNENIENTASENNDSENTFASESKRALLRIAYEGIKGEFARIDRLLTHTGPEGEQHPLGNSYPTVHNKFVGPKGVVEDLLARLKTYVEKEDLDENELEDAWKNYVNLRSKALPSLASELLAVIGGVYLQMANLECLGGVRDIEGRLSFTNEAHALVIEMILNSGTEWASVLIVGEERLDHFEAEVIRLRFPACDLWNLPLTAHELGFLVLHKDKAKSFVAKLSEVQRQLSPESYDPKDPPKREDYYLEGFAKLWDEFGSEEDAYREERRNELETLIKQQDIHLRRLFADAFATAVAGPAYVYALVYLRLVPDETFDHPTLAMPPFVDRLVVSLEILRWLQEDPFVRVRAPESFSKADFSNIVYSATKENDRGIPAFWQWTMQSIDPSIDHGEMVEEYQRICRKYGEWLDIIKDDLAKLHKAITATYENWVEAQELKEKLRVTVSDDESVSNRLTLLNAAWAACHESCGDYETIEAQAISLIPRVGKKPNGTEKKETEHGTARAAGRPADSQKRPIGENIEEDKQLVVDALQDYTFELQDFEEMFESKTFPREKVKSIEQAFRDKENKAAFDAFRRIKGEFSRS